MNRADSSKKKYKWPKTQEKRSTSLAIKEMQIKTMLRFYLTPVRMLPSTTQTTINAMRMWGKRNSYTSSQFVAKQPSNFQHIFAQTSRT
jgi:hypothetical protein